MKSLKLALAAAALAAYATGCGGNATTNTNQTANSNARAGANAPTPAPTATATPDELARAAGDFSQFCARCHKTDGTGGMVDLEDGKKLEVLSLREHGLKDSDEHLAEQIRKGGDGMPPFEKRLDAERINNLVRFIRREFHGRSAAAPAGPLSPAPAH